MSNYVDDAAEQILSQKRVLLRHPGSRGINELYPTPNRSSTQLAEVVNARGRYVVSGNSLQIPGTTNFSISTSSIIENWEVHATINLPANAVVNTGWLFQAISRVEITYANSLMQSIQISGLALREFLLSNCHGPKCKEDLLYQAGYPTVLAPAANASHSASIPVGNLIISALGQKGQFGIDQSTLSGPIQVLIRWNDFSAFGSKIGANAVVAPTAFSSLKLTCGTSDLLSGAFSVRQALSMDPSLSYSIPVKYLNSLNIPVTNFDPTIADNEQVFNLTSAPAGMLETIIISYKPRAEISSPWVPGGAVAGYNSMPGNVNLKSMRLTYGGTDLFKAETPSEIDANYRSCFGGDTMNYMHTAHLFTGDPATGPTVVINQFKGQCYQFPLMFDGCSVLQGKGLTENLPSYSGATLECRLAVDERMNRRQYLAAAPFSGVNAPVTTAGVIPFNLEVCYVIAGILEISQGSVDLQL